MLTDPNQLRAAIFDGANRILQSLQDSPDGAIEHSATIAHLELAILSVANSAVEREEDLAYRAAIARSVDEQTAILERIARSLETITTRAG